MQTQVQQHVKRDWITRHAQDWYGVFLNTKLALTARGPQLNAVTVTNDTTLSGPLLLEVLDIQDIRHSKQSLLTSLCQDGAHWKEQTRERLDTIERGELKVARGMLKLMVTDGTRVVPALEYGQIDALSVFSKRGCKLYVKQVRVVMGTLLLDGTNTTVLGGCVDELNAGSNMVVRLKEQLN
jgi:hypothetical protein